MAEMPITSIYAINAVEKPNQAASPMSSSNTTIPLKKRSHAQNMSAKIVSIKRGNLDVILSDADRGFLQAISEINAVISNAHQQVNETESHKILDWLWDQTKQMELQKLGRAPFDEVTKKIEFPERS